MAGSYKPKTANWINSGWGFRAQTLDQLLFAVSRLGTHNVGKRYVWRGVDTASYRMRSSLFGHVANELGRPPLESELRSYERGILSEARRWGIGADQGLAATDLHILAQLQHEGVPTRLLDVTPNPMTALWFACASKLHTTGVIFAYEVSDWHHVTTTDTLAGTYDGLEGKSALDVTLEAARIVPTLITPRNTTGRLAAQEGLFFTGVVPSTDGVAGVDGVSLGEGLRPLPSDRLASLLTLGQRYRGRPASVPFCAIVIPSGIKKAMLAHLSTTYNRSRAVLFPDAGGFKAAFLNNEVSKTPLPEPQPGTPGSGAVSVMV